MEKLSQNGFPLAHQRHTHAHTQRHTTTHTDIRTHSNTHARTSRRKVKSRMQRVVFRQSSKSANDAADDRYRCRLSNCDSKLTYRKFVGNAVINNVLDFFSLEIG